MLEKSYREWWKRFREREYLGHKEILEQEYLNQEGPNFPSEISATWDFECGLRILYAHEDTEDGWKFIRRCADIVRVVLPRYDSFTDDDLFRRGKLLRNKAYAQGLLESEFVKFARGA